MTKEQEEAIKYFKNYTIYTKQLSEDEKRVNGQSIYQKDIEKRAKYFETVLSMLKENSAEIEQKNTELAEKNAEIERLNRQIDLMAKEINETDRGYTDYCEMKIECDRNCKDCIKRYFERKVTNNG